MMFTFLYQWLERSVWLPGVCALPAPTPILALQTLHHCLQGIERGAGASSSRLRCWKSVEHQNRDCLQSGNCHFEREVYINFILLCCIQVASAIFLCTPLRGYVALLSTAGLRRMCSSQGMFCTFDGWREEGGKKLHLITHQKKQPHLLPSCVFMTASNLLLADTATEILTASTFKEPCYLCWMNWLTWLLFEGSCHTLDADWMLDLLKAPGRRWQAQAWSLVVLTGLATGPAMKR